MTDFLIRHRDMLEIKAETLRNAAQSCEDKFARVRMFQAARKLGDAAGKLDEAARILGYKGPGIDAADVALHPADSPHGSEPQRYRILPAGDIKRREVAETKGMLDRSTNLK